MQEIDKKFLFLVNFSIKYCLITSELKLASKKSQATRFYLIYNECNDAKQGETITEVA